MIRVSTLMGSLVLLVTMNTAGLAQDAEAGKAKAGTCVACHSSDGNSPLEQFPKIAGQVPGYVADQLARFKSGERPGTVMMEWSPPSANRIWPIWMPGIPARP